MVKKLLSVCWRWILRLSLLSVVILLGGLLLYSWSLSEKIEKRFSERRWHIPSRVYSDITIVYPGQQINTTLFYEKLKRLGYRSVTHQPDQPGEVRVSRNAAVIFLKALEIPTRHRDALPVQLTLKKGFIQSIQHLTTGEILPLVMIEPEEIMLFFGKEREDRTLISIENLPPHMIHAVLAAEDTRFFDHFGVDPLGILRAIYVNLRHGSIRQGGSTLTQQLAKNYFLTAERTFSRKFKELIIALILEYQFDKKEILEIYLNEIYLGQKGSVSINGIGEASFLYFGKPVDRLDAAEAATLAGLIKGPNLYSPYKDRERCIRRRNRVLKAMRKHGWLSEPEMQKAMVSPIQTAGFETYGKRAPFFMDYLSEQLQKLYSPETLSSLGLSIYTTLDTQVQSAAEAAVKNGLSRLEAMNPQLKRRDETRQLQAAVIVMQPKTGAILAMVGGRDYSVSQFNRMTQARRQPGSAFKPFVYLPALERFSPVSRLSNVPRTIAYHGNVWRPKNFEPHAPPVVSLRTALAGSYNLATVDLAMQIGLQKIVDTAMQFDFSTPLKPYPSISLGAFEMIPVELARAYCVFAADGFQPYPLSLKNVLDEQGKVLERRHMTIERVITPAKAFLMTSLLQSVVEDGTARNLRKLGITVPVAGKTGTTNDSRDAWFVGYTPDILALVWVGFDNGDSIEATGSSAAMPIWADLMRHVPQYLSGGMFKKPPGVVRRSVCSESGYLAREAQCPEILEEFFLLQNAPTQPCPIHAEKMKPKRPRKKPSQPVPLPENPRERYFRRFNNFDK